MGIAALLYSLGELLVGLIIRYGGAVVFQILVFFGIRFVAQDYVVTPFVANIQTWLGGAPVMVIQSLAAIRFDQAITVILSAYATAAAGRLVLRKHA